MKIACVADIHYPTNFQMFESAMQGFGEADVFFLAGDVSEHFRPGGYKKVVELIRKYYQGDIYAVFGNTEHDQDKDKIEADNPDVKFLDDESVKLDKDTGLVGTRGSLDRPTTWQSKNVKGIEKVYEQRVGKVKELLAGIKTDKKILLMHYSPTHQTLGKESKNIWENMACVAFEEVIGRQEPNLVIHAHAHRGIPKALVHGVPVYNVSLPVNQKIVVIDVDRVSKQSLRGFGE